MILLRCGLLFFFFFDIFLEAFWLKLNQRRFDLIKK